MPVTLTIKQVPDRTAEKLRARAAANHRSLQGEMMVILEEALKHGAFKASEPVQNSYAATPPDKATSSRKTKTPGKRLTLAELWERSRRLANPSKSESTAIVRKLRDERYGR